MGDTVKEITNIAEEVTNTTTPEASALTLIDWFIGLFRHIASSANPADVASAHADVIEANKTNLAAAVAANPQ